MTDIIIRTSDGRVQAVADQITLVGDYFDAVAGGEHSHLPVSSFGFTVALVSHVTGVPSDLVGGYNYNYASGVFADSGVAPPAPPEPAPVDIWTNKRPIATASFVAIVLAAIGSPAWTRIQTDPAGAGIYAQIMTATTVDPNIINPDTGRNDFRTAIHYLATTNGADGQKLLTSANVTAINAGWPNA